MQRREFLEFLGRSTFLSAMVGSTSLLQACSTLAGSADTSSLKGLPASSADKLSLLPGFTSQVLARWGDVVTPQGDRFGFNNDFIAFFEGASSNEAFLWVNHEYVNPLFVSGYNPAKNIGVRKAKSQVEEERKNVGGTYLRIEKKQGQWVVDASSPKNFRIDATTPMRIVAERPIQGSLLATGTTGNCCGGKTPWGTILTCEENHEDFFGQVRFSKKGKKWKRHLIASSHVMAWDDHWTPPPEHYGWVVEVNPRTKECRKLTALGRFAHEGALVLKAQGDRVVVYMGDDSKDQHFYKFISEKPGTLDSGKLYVAKLETGTWELLSMENPVLKDHFQDQTDLLIRTREAAKLVGATPLDRPEACAQDPIGKGIYLNCTMNKTAGRPFGSILKFVEKNNNPLSLHFESSVFLHGGAETGFACPDNLCFDAQGNMWMTTDIADYDVNSGEYSSFGNNSLFFIPLSGPQAGQAVRVATAPAEAEMTGPCFSADGKTLFISIQHPGANSTDLENLTSHWPDGGTSIPRPSVVAIQGPWIKSTG